MSQLLFDIGANKGRYARAAIRTGKYGKIVCVDPCRACAGPLRQLCAEAAAQGSTRVLYVPRAVSDRSGQRVTLFESTVDAISSLHPEWIQSERFASLDGRGANSSRVAATYEVETVRIDHLIKQFGMPDRLKIDVELHEEQALLGLSQKVPELCFEFAIESADSVARILARLRTELGFRDMHVQFEDRYDYEPPSSGWRPIADYESSWLQDPSGRWDSWGMIWAR